MVGFSFSEMLFLMVLALVVFGPKRLPDIGRKIGKILGDFRRASNEFKAQISDEVNRMEIHDATNGIQNTWKDIGNTIAQSPRPPLDQQFVVPRSTTVRDDSFDAGFTAASNPDVNSEDDSSKGQHA